jgi:hypothetical protein
MGKEEIAMAQENTRYPDNPCDPNPFPEPGTDAERDVIPPRDLDRQRKSDDKDDD